jgi:VacB/RNase II family 3'-5' exoribonuclease
MNNESTDQRSVLQRIARRAMAERGLLSDFSPEAQAQLAQISAARPASDRQLRDLRALPWASIDNDDSRDLDQLTVAQDSTDAATKILVAIADVDALVVRDTAIDVHAHHNTTSIYTAAEIFPMLPERLSTDLTSLSDHADRSAIVVEMQIAADGTLSSSDVYRALVRNQAKLAYNSVAAWLDGKGPEPEPIGRVPGLADNLRTQDRVAQVLATRRHEHGALDLQTIEARAVFELNQLTSLEVDEKNRAKDIIEDFMIAANGVTARFLTTKGFASLRRVVRVPKRWDRIVALAASLGQTLPAEPDAKALGAFLATRRTADPLRFPDLSLSIVKLLGAGEYVAEVPGAPVPGHFGLAVRDYGHSTAPNRRFPDLVTQRLMKAALVSAPAPYSKDELTALAAQCTQREDDANKVERLVRKAAAALLMQNRKGERFDGIVTGASAKGTWVRILKPPVEGRVIRGEQGLDVGDRVTVQLVDTDVERGFIDFARAS